MTGGSERQSKHFAVVLENLRGQALDRERVGIAFFWSGFVTGHRMRIKIDTARDPAKGEALQRSLGLQRDDPFSVGWRLGWRFAGRVNDE